MRSARSSGARRLAADPVGDRAVGAGRALAGDAFGEHLQGTARLPVPLLRAERAGACAPPTSSMPRSRSATTANGCTTSCMRSIAIAASRCRARRRRSRDCTRSLPRAARRTASTRRRSCRSAPRSMCSCRAMSSGCTGARRQGALAARRESTLRSGPTRSAASSCTAASTGSTASSDGRRLELIDYKTGSSSQLKEKAARPLRGHAARLLRGPGRAESGLPLRAVLSRARRHQGARDRTSTRRSPPSADALVVGIAEDLRRLRAGAGLAPLGEGSACTYCDARGLCRRDHWTRAHARRRATLTTPRPSVRAMTAPAFRIDDAPASREAFYALACDPARSCAVEACAGSGKTWMLVSRMLRALLDGAEPQEILAITFTRAAAGEMRQRLSEWLAAYSTPRSTHAQRVQALVERGVPPRAPRRWLRRSASCRAACSPPAGRSRSAPFTPGSRSCCARRR